MHVWSRNSPPEQSSSRPMSAQPALDWCISKNSMGVSQISHIVVGSSANCVNPKGLSKLYVEDQAYN